MTGGGCSADDDGEQQRQEEETNTRTNDQTRTTELPVTSTDNSESGCIQQLESKENAQGSSMKHSGNNTHDMTSTDTSESGCIQRVESKENAQGSSTKHHGSNTHDMTPRKSGTALDHKDFNGVAASSDFASMVEEKQVLKEKFQEQGAGIPGLNFEAKVPDSLNCDGVSVVSVPVSSGIGKRKLSEVETAVVVVGEPAAVSIAVEMAALGDKAILNEDGKIGDLKRIKIDAAETSVEGANARKANSEQWDDMFERLKAYKNEKGDCLVPKRYPADPKLGNWVETQRVQYKRLQREFDTTKGVEAVTPNKRLSKERLARLESIGFAWSAKNVPRLSAGMRHPARQPACPPLDITVLLPDPSKYFNTGPYATSTSSSNSTSNNKNDNINSKTNSANRSSSSHVNGATEVAPKEGSAIGFAAGARKPSKPSKARTTGESASRAQGRGRLQENQWEEMYQRLVKYKEKHGDCLVPRKYEEDSKLATWVDTQRVLWNRDYRDKNVSKSDVPSRNSSYSSLPYVPGHGTDDPTFPVDQRNARGEGQVATATALEVGPYGSSSGGPYSTASGAIDASAGEVNGVAHSFVQDSVAVATCVPTAIPMPASDGVALPADTVAFATASVDPEWAAAAEPSAAPSLNAVSSTARVSLARAPAQPKRLTPERKAKLDAIGFVWSLRSKRIEDHWDEMFRQLLQYKEQHGDCLVPSRYEQNLKLGKWVETQRYEYTKLQRTAAGGGAAANEECGTNAGNRPARPTNARLTEERIRRLESIGFEWKVKHKMKRYYDKQWDQMFERLLKFKEANGHCAVPKRYPPDLKLGTWVHTQRIQYRKLVNGTKKDGDVTEQKDAAFKDMEPAIEQCEPGKEALDAVLPDAGTGELSGKAEEEVSFRLTDDRRRRLEAVGFIWSAKEGEKAPEQGRITRNSFDDQWDIMFSRLKAYKERYGDCLVPKRSKEDPKLGTWVDTQRVQYKKMKKKLAEKGIEYSSRASAGSGLEMELEAEGGVGGVGAAAGASSSTVTRPVVGRLTDERIRQLENLGFVWSLRDDWQKHYNELRGYKGRHGHCNVPARYPENRRLGIWVSAQRQQYKMLQQNQKDPRAKRPASLSQERIDLLNDIGFTWTIRSRDSLADAWNAKYHELMAYKAIHGDTDVPEGYPANPDLGTWVAAQRTLYGNYMEAKAKGENSAMFYSEDRVMQLEQLGFTWTNTSYGDTSANPSPQVKQA